MAAAIGNQYAAKEKRWAMAINRALEKRSRVDQVQALDGLAEKLLELCEQGELSALKELGDRLDGKSAQSVTVGGEEGNPLNLFGKIEWQVVSPKP